MIYPLFSPLRLGGLQHSDKPEVRDAFAELYNRGYDDEVCCIRRRIERAGTSVPIMLHTMVPMEWAKESMNAFDDDWKTNRTMIDILRGYSHEKWRDKTMTGEDHEGWFNTSDCSLTLLHPLTYYQALPLLNFDILPVVTENQQYLPDANALSKHYKRRHASKLEHAWGVPLIEVRGEADIRQRVLRPEPRGLHQK